MNDGGQAQTAPTQTPEPTSGRTYLVFRYIRATDLGKMIEDGEISVAAELLLPVGSHDADESDDAIKAVAKRDNAEGKEHAAVPERNFRRRTPKKKVTETWGFDD